MNLYDILDIVRNVLYISVLIVALLYSCLILLIRRFRYQNNIFIVNFCVNAISTGIYFTIYFYAVDYKMAQSMCAFFHYAFNVASVQVPFAFVAFTIHRFFGIVFHVKVFFRTRQWVILCISIQWIAQFLISLPLAFAHRRSCTGNTFWMGIYTVVTAIPLPSLVNMIFNIWIFIYVRKSSRRIQPQNISGIQSGNNHPQARVNHRDISLLKQMIFTFIMFIVGWTPALVINTITANSHVDSIILMGSVFLSVICLVALMINLFIYNHDVRQFIFNEIRHCIHY